jgi:hypothetical protein
MKKLLIVFFLLICFGIWGAKAHSAWALNGNCAANGYPKNSFDCHYDPQNGWNLVPQGVAQEGCNTNFRTDIACSPQNKESNYYGGSSEVCVPCIPADQVPTKQWGDSCTDNKECDGNAGLGCYPSSNGGKRCLYAPGTQEILKDCQVGENECRAQSLLTSSIGIALACVSATPQDKTGKCTQIAAVTKNCTTGENGLTGDAYCRNKFPRDPGAHCVLGECVLTQPSPNAIPNNCDKQGNLCCTAKDEMTKQSTYYCAAGFFPSSQTAACVCNSGEGLGATNLCTFADNNAACLDCARNLGIWTPFGCIRANTQFVVQDILKIAIGIAGGIAFLMLVYAGFLRMTSQGVPEKLTNSNEIALSAIAGLLLIIFSAVILKLIGIDILHIPGLI